VTTPFDDAIRSIEQARYHNHRLEGHSDLVSDGIISDLQSMCAPFSSDLENGAIQIWKNVSAPGDRRRKVDLFVGEPTSDGSPDIQKVRLAVENKSVITAHRNRTNRFDDLLKVLSAVHGARPEAIVVATVMIGVSRRMLNIPDQVHKFFRDREDEFDARILPRLSSGDLTLWDEFDWAISPNSATDAQKSVDLFRSLPTRGSGHTHVEGYDYVMLVPVEIDNVSPPGVKRDNSLGIDVDAEYQRLLERICAAYTARWHM
jgi:hypothetical protein